MFKIFNLKNIKFLILIFGLVANLFFSWGNFCSAVPTEGPGTLLQNVQKESGYAEATEFSLSEIIGFIIYTILGLLGVIFLGLVVFAGYLWLTAGGDSKKVEEAQKYLKNGIIGLIIILAAAGITQFVLVNVLAIFYLSQPA